MSADPVATLLRAAFALRSAVPSLVEAWLGPSTMWESAATGAVLTPAQAVSALTRLRDGSATVHLPPARRGFLAAQGGALCALAEDLRDGPRPLPAAVRARLGAPVPAGDLDRYRAAHDRLDEALPGTGTVRARLAAHHARTAVPTHRVSDAASAIVAALRAGHRVPLPVGESVRVAVVDEPRGWSGHATVRTGPRSVVRVAGGRPVRAATLARSLAHESYPGHHVEQCLLFGVVAARPEQGLLLDATPRAVVAEGLAESALDVGIGPGWGSGLAAALAEVGVLIDGDEAERVDRALAPLRAVRWDAVLAVHSGVARSDAIALLRRWSLLSPERAAAVLDVALARPISTAASVLGHRLVADWLGRGPVAERIHRLCTEPLLPTDIGPATTWAPDRCDAERVAAVRSDADRVVRVE